MKFRHEERSIKLLAPFDVRMCDYESCSEMGSFRLMALDDKDHTIFDYQNICDKHIISAFLNFLIGD